jgi:heme/copper-type cytochrome/quinol oxidase subunit 2
MMMIRPFAGVVLMAAIVATGVRAQKTPHHVFDVSARRYAFQPSTLEVHLGDLVRVTFRTGDIPHSFVLEDYRIAKRANPGETVTIEFLADRAGRFKFYCNLNIDDGCRKMTGELVVSPDSRPNASDR